MRRSLPFLWAGLCLLACGAPLVGQEGRIFRKTPDTIGIWEFNDIPGAPGEGLPDDTIIADLSGNGLDARVMANGDGTIAAGEGDDCFGTNTGLDRVGAGFMSRVTVEDDEAFQFGPDEDFSFELYVQRDEAIGGENWGILAGTWHSRTVLDDAVDPTVNGAWYGFGYIRHNEGGGWHLVLSPINEDRTFTPGFNEIQSGVFDIPPGFHYLVTVVDRATETAWVYLDDAIVAQVAIPPGSAFYTPAGYEAEPSHLTFLNGVDDLTRAGGYRPPPSGYTIDAARVISRALTAEEVLVNYFDLLDCLAIPTDAETETQAVLTSTSDNVIVGQCVRLSAANSVAEEGEEIVGYQWKIGDGAFEGGEVTREISFGEPSPANGIPVTVRVTDSAGGSAEATVMIRVSHPMPRAIIDARLAGDVLVGSSIILAEGDVVDLDASGSFTPIPANALECPIDAGVPVEAPAITEYRWDLDGDGTVDATTPTATLDSLVAGSTFDVTLTVVNESDEEASTSISVEVVERPCVEPAPTGRVFLPTTDTIALWEFNDLGGVLGEALLNDTIIEDLSGNGLDATVEANDGGSLVVGEGDARFDENTAARKAVGGGGRVVVNDDGQVFEMDETQDFSIELFVRRDEVVSGENWGILAGTWHSRSVLDDGQNPDTEGAWYGYGFIRTLTEGGWAFILSPIQPDGSYTPGNNEIKSPVFDIPAGVHYVVGTVDRVAQRASVYLDGELRGSVLLPAGTSFVTPPGHDPARFMFFSGEDDSTRGAYRAAPSGFAIDAARVLSRALTEEEIASNYRLMRVGVAVPPEPCSGGPLFVRGDADASGGLNLTDGVRILNYLFVGNAEVPCLDAADTDDSGSLNLSDGIYILSYLFSDGSPPPAPHMACGPDPTEDSVDCVAFAPCAQ